MNHSAPATAQYANPADPKANSQERRPVCDNLLGHGHPCASRVEVRNVLMFGSDGSGPTPLWCCASCEKDLNDAGHVVARVLSRVYGTSVPQMERIRDRFAEQAELWPSGS